jgi:hypothetical protein
MYYFFSHSAWKAKIKMAALFAVGLFLSSCYTVTEVQQFDGVRMVRLKRGADYRYVHDPLHELESNHGYTPKQIQRIISH